MPSHKGTTLALALGLDLGFKYEDDTAQSQFGLMKAIIENADLMMGDDVPLRFEIGNIRNSNMLRFALLSIDGVNERIFPILRELQKMSGSNQITNHMNSESILEQLAFEIGDKISDPDSPEDIANATSYGLTWLMSQNITYTI